MKIYVNRVPIKGPWGGGAHFVNAFHEFAALLGHELVPPNSMTTTPEVLLLAGLDNDGNGVSAEQAINFKWMMAAQSRNVKLVLRVNECDARKGTRHVDNHLLKLFPHMDSIVFVSHWLREYFMEKGWHGNNDTVIINGLNKEIFRSQPKLDNGKINIVAHHWSDNRMKGADTYEKIDKLVGDHKDLLSFTYIGRHNCNFKHTNVIKPLSGKQLGDELGKHDIYVSALVNQFHAGYQPMFTLMVADALNLLVLTILTMIGRILKRSCLVAGLNQTKPILERGKIASINMLNSSRAYKAI